MELNPRTPSWRSVPRRDRITLLAALGGVTALAWAYLIRISSGSMASSGSMEIMRLRAWDSGDFLLVFLMWAVMMVGMMLPTAVPMTMIFAAVGRKAARQGAVVAPTLSFVAGYVAAWTLFAALATLAQWGLERAALLSPMMVSTSPLLGAGLLIAAGVYQLTPAKSACLSHCRSPAHFISGHWRMGTAGAFRMGLDHGFYCLGCCWALMALLFVGGVMNLLLIAAIAVFVLLEKIFPRPKWPQRIAGGGLIVTGLALLVAWL